MERGHPCPQSVSSTLTPFALRAHAGRDARAPSRRLLRFADERSMSFRLADYLPILLMFAVAAGFALTFIGLSQLVGQRKRTRTKLMPYECGKDPVGSARERFSVKFYLIAMIFILFDIEVIFLVPWAVVFRRLSSPEYGLSNVVFFEMIIFIALLAAGLIYVIKKGAFDWSENARREAEAEARLLEKKVSSSRFQVSSSSKAA
jgi:NADH-quinone oxidoreductase subunit A